MTPQEKLAFDAAKIEARRLAKLQPRPKRVNIPPEPVGDPHPATYLEPKYRETLEHNQKLNLCCRHVEESNHSAQWFATPSAERTKSGQIIPDVLVIRCGQCNRPHTRAFLGSGPRRIVRVVN